MIYRFDIDVFISFCYVIIASGKIRQRPFRPVFQIKHLHFQIDDRIIVEKYMDIQNKCFVINRFPKLNRILHNNILHISSIQLQASTYNRTLYILIIKKVQRPLAQDPCTFSNHYFFIFIFFVLLQLPYTFL